VIDTGYDDLYLLGDLARFGHGLLLRSWAYLSIVRSSVPERPWGDDTPPNPPMIKYAAFHQRPTDLTPWHHAPKAPLIAVRRACVRDHGPAEVLADKSPGLPSA
jgi:hypothetical protein